MRTRCTRPTRVAVLTADGRGAIAVLRVWGPEAIHVVDAAFRPLRGRPLADTPDGQVRVGRIGDGLGDEVVAVILSRAAPTVEVQCHGGVAAVRLVLEALRREGAEHVSTNAWLQADAPSVLSAQAWADLPLAPTARTAEILLDQANGALERELIEVVELMHSGETTASLDRLHALLRRWDIGSRLLGGWRIVLAGRPNVGKSRLLNALAGFDRAIVDPTPGTTRDVVTMNTAIDGWPVEVADTAGLRATTNPIEAEGLALATSRQRDADLVLLVLDRSEPLTTSDLGLLDAYPAAMRVANKADLSAAWEPAAVGALSVSAECGEGVEALIAAIGLRIVANAPSTGSGVPFRARHARLLARACRYTELGRRDRAVLAVRALLERSINPIEAARGSG